MGGGGGGGGFLCLKFRTSRFRILCVRILGFRAQDSRVRLLGFVRIKPFEGAIPGVKFSGKVSFCDEWVLLCSSAATSATSFPACVLG